MRGSVQLCCRRRKTRNKSKSENNSHENVLEIFFQSANLFFTLLPGVDRRSIANRMEHYKIRMYKYNI